MEFKTLTLSELRNGEHFQFQTDIKDLIEKQGPGKLGIQAVFDAYIPHYINESKVYRKWMKSAVTDELISADKKRDSTFRGTSESVNAALRHFNQNTQDAGRRVKVVFEHYGDITTEPYDEKTAVINKLIIDLNETCVNDMATIGISDWIAHLQANNDAFVELKKSRYTEEATKTHLAMKEVRHLVDKSYRDINNCLSAMILMNGETDYIEFVNEFNSRVESYDRILAQRRGRNNDDTPPVPEA